MVSAGLRARIEWEPDRRECQLPADSGHKHPARGPAIIATRNIDAAIVFLSLVMIAALRFRGEHSRRPRRGKGESEERYTPERTRQQFENQRALDFPSLRNVPLSRSSNA
jgi:hypothetical protein